MSGAHNYPIHHLHGCHIGDGCTECNGRGIVLCYIGTYLPDEEESPC
jgi:hypothetical protein